MTFTQASHDTIPRTYSTYEVLLCIPLSLRVQLFFEYPPYLYFDIRSIPSVAVSTPQEHNLEYIFQPFCSIILLTPS